MLKLWKTCFYLLTAAFCVWAGAALFFDFPFPAFRLPLAVAYLATAAFLALGKMRVAVPVSALVVLIWWLTLKPTNEGNWQPDVDRVAWADVSGNLATIHNIRDFSYVSETNFTPHWETRVVDIATIRGVDLFESHWGSPWIAHIIVSFAFDDGTHLAASVEARKTVGQEYSAIRGFFRQYEVLYLMATERDVVGVRTSYRGESVYLYRTMTKPEDAQRLFRQYLEWMNRARVQPEWYNALTRSCITDFSRYLAKARIGGVGRWDWRILLDGRSDEMLYDLGDLAGGLPFAELRKRALIQAAPKDATDRQFSEAIRQGRPGFGSDSSGPSHAPILPSLR